MLKCQQQVTVIIGYWIRTGDGSYVDCVINPGKPDANFRNIAMRVADSATHRTRILHHITPMEVHLS